MSIQGNVLAVKARVLANEQPFAEQLKLKALKAIYGNAADWVAYMSFFAAADKPEQLARLIPTDGTDEDKAMNEARAYLIAAAPCTPDTVAHFEKGVTAILDEGLEE